MSGCGGQGGGALGGNGGGDVGTQPMLAPHVRQDAWLHAYALLELAQVEHHGSHLAHSVGTKQRSSATSIVGTVLYRYTCPDRCSVFSQSKAGWMHS